MGLSVDWVIISHSGKTPLLCLRTIKKAMKEYHVAFKLMFIFPFESLARKNAKKKY